MGIQVEPKTACKMLFVRYCDTGGDDSDAGKMVQMVMMMVMTVMVMVMMMRMMKLPTHMTLHGATKS